MEKITPNVDFQPELSTLFRLDGKTVFIPGGYGGIGESIAWGAAHIGATVVIAGRSKEKANTLAQQINDAGFRASSECIDATSVEDIRATVGRITKVSNIDVLINCVGIQREEPLTEVTEEAFDAVYTTNLKGAMFVAQAVARHQIANEIPGKHVHVLSVRSTLGLRDRGYSAYCATKGGSVMLLRQHAMELARHNITVNGVSPTFVYTEMIRHVMENDEFRNGLLNRIPLGKIADPKDIVGPALFFASSASNFVTGQNLLVDGGISASQ